jgi:L-lactate dehydrogenase complex protein LldG
MPNEIRMPKPEPAWIRVLFAIRISDFLRNPDFGLRISNKCMTERDRIFARIREALTVPAPVPGHHAGAARRSVTLPTPADHRRVLPAVGSSDGERVALFARNAAELRADFRLLEAPSELAVELQKLAAAEDWIRVASHRGALTDVACRALGLPVLLTDAPFDKVELEQCPVGISECDALIAQTGSVLVTSRSAGGRALSVLPPHHVVLARRDQLLADLPEAFALLKTRYGTDPPSMISFITGPSRTGDIERILVLGAHGPKKLTILCA